MFNKVLFCSILLRRIISFA